MRTPLQVMRDIKDNFIMATINRRTLGGGSVRVNPMHSNIFRAYNKTYTEIMMTKNLYENMAWYEGDTAKLQYFYNIELPQYRLAPYSYDKDNYFYARIDEGDYDTRRILNSGLAPLASSKMADITFGSGFEYEVLRIDENTRQQIENARVTMSTEEAEKLIRELKQQSESAIDKYRLGEILQDNKFDNLSIKATETASWSGGKMYKIITNTEISDKPIIQVIQPEYYEIKTEYGRPYQYIFKEYYKKQDGIKNGKPQYKNYVLHEIYGLNGQHAYIDYELYEILDMKEDQEYKRIELSSLEDTKDLNPSEWIDAKNYMCVYIPNKAVNNRFRNSILGESDYLGATGMFDAIDEFYSTIMREYRESELDVYYPDNWLRKDKNGNIINPKNFGKRYQVYKGDRKQDGAINKIEYEKAETSINNDMETLQMLIQNALNVLGLSPSTIGISNANENTNEEAQREREKTTQRTARTKKTLWKPYYEQLFKILLIADDLMNGNVPGDYEVIFSFNDYLEATFEERLENAGNAITNMVSDIRTAQDLIYGDTMTEEEKTLKSINIKIENTIPLTPQDEEFLINAGLRTIETEGEIIEEVEEEVDGE